MQGNYLKPLLNERTEKQLYLATAFRLFPVHFYKLNVSESCFPALLQLNPQHALPTIDDDGFGLGER
jgi:glutathione S-transferase